MKRILNIFIFSLFVLQNIHAQDTLRVLFLGNSYTYYNNLPQMVQELSKAANKTIITDSYTIGGYTLYDHSYDSVALNKIRVGHWDYIVLQEQSQIPTIEYYKTNLMYTAALRLKDSIELYNPCGKIISYMTWGRRYGGQQCDANRTYCSPVFTDFNHMQDSLTSAYLGMSQLLHATCAPVGVAWKNILADTNFVLHIADNTHPTLEGSYIAACVLYTSIWKQKSEGLSYTAGLPATTANYFQLWSDSTVYKSFNNWNLNKDTLNAYFTYTPSSQKFSIKFTNNSSSQKNIQYIWDFGDGTTSTDSSPEHIYATSGKYLVTLKVLYCHFVDSFTEEITIENPVGIIETKETEDIEIYPNPAKEILNINFNTEQPKSISIYNNTGQLVQSLNNCNHHASFDLTSIKGGVYMVIIYMNDRTIVKKLVKTNSPNE